VIERLVGVTPTGRPRLRARRYVLGPPHPRSISQSAGLATIGAFALVAMPFGGASVVHTRHAASLANGPASQVSPRPDTGNGGFSAVACVSTSMCITVGNYTNSIGNRLPMSETWNGHSWSLVPIPDPPDRPDINLFGLSCATPESCIAVGSYDAGPQPGAISESWNGRSWRIVPMPVPKGVTPPVTFQSISCSSADTCVAVGNRDPKAYVGYWNGLSWSLGTLPVAASSSNTYISSVSCGSPTACMAVGNAGRDGKPVALSWNGSSWSAIALVAPPELTYVTPMAVSCPSATVCMMTGNYTPKGTGGTGLPLAGRWAGGKWSFTAINPAGSNSGLLWWVSCSSANACLAVGYDQAGPLAESWNGVRWAPASGPHASRDAFNAVACAANGDCFVVGQGYVATGPGTTLAELWQGGRLTVIPTPNVIGASSDFLSGVSCPSTSSCIAVGGHLTGAGIGTPLAELEKGSRWVRVAVPSPPSSTSSSLDSVSCGGVGDCVAIGSYSTAKQLNEDFAATWNGTGWALHPMPQPPGEDPSSAWLGSISCPAPSACVAVGGYTKAGGTIWLSMAMSWNGSKWRFEHVPNPEADPMIQLMSVSCASISDCVAVGWDGNASTNFAEHWNGSTWHISSPPPSSHYGAVFGVACPSQGVCIAVGYDQNTAGVVNFADEWNGSRWTRLADTIGLGRRDNAPRELSCPTTTSCMGVGGYLTTSGADLALAEHWAGKNWSIVSPAEPGGGATTNLGAVSAPPSIAASQSDISNTTAWTTRSSKRGTAAVGSFRRRQGRDDLLERAHPLASSRGFERPGAPQSGNDLESSGRGGGQLVAVAVISVNSYHLRG
jgi:hypothetical protein